MYILDLQIQVCTCTNHCTFFKCKFTRHKFTSIRNNDETTLSIAMHTHKWKSSSNNINYFKSNVTQSLYLNSMFMGYLCHLSQILKLYETMGQPSHEVPTLKVSSLKYNLAVPTHLYMF